MCDCQENCKAGHPSPPVECGIAAAGAIPKEGREELGGLQEQLDSATGPKKKKLRQKLRKRIAALEKRLAAVALDQGSTASTVGDGTTAAASSVGVASGTL